MVLIRFPGIMRNSLIILALCLALLLVNLDSLQKDRHPHVLVFGGVRCDILGGAFFPPPIPLFILDFPLSFALDVLILPAAIIQYDERDPSPFHGLGGC